MTKYLEGKDTMDPVITTITDNIRRVIVGKEELIKELVIAYLCEGHILLEGDPGVGKTKLALALAKSIEGEFKRIQFTPDVLPSDITGYCILNRQTTQLEYKQGAAFCNFLLADEINRASPRVQSSLLEAMEERQVTIEGVRRELPEGFMVLATQNTIEQQGTYPLPEAQLDRFFMKLHIAYPSHSEWEKILDLSEEEDALSTLKQVVTLEEIQVLKTKLREITVSPAIKEYIIRLAEQICHHQMVQIGVSPRGTIALLKASKGYALLEGRSYVLPDDVQKVLLPVVGHRIVLTGHTESRQMKIEKLITTVLQTVNVPVIE